VQGGVEVHCENLYTRVARSAEVFVFTRAPYVDGSVKEFKGVRLISLPAVKNKFLEAFFHTLFGVCKARSLNPDILHFQGIGPSFWIPLARILGMKAVLTTHGQNYKHLKWGRAAKVFLRFCERVGMNSADKIIAISRVISEDIRKDYGRNAVVIPNGVEIPSPVTTDEALGKYGLSAGKYILTVGRFVPEKGYHDLIEAFREKARGGMPQGQSSLRGVSGLPEAGAVPFGWKLVIVGDVDHEDAYSRRLKEEAGKDPLVVLTGKLSGRPLRELYSHAGLFVLPSYYEGLPIVLLEAMSYGLSCIVSDIPANKELDLGQERYFEPGDVHALAVKMREFIGKPLSSEEKKAEIDKVRERYNWDKIAGQTLAVYKDLLKR